MIVEVEIDKTTNYPTRITLNCLCNNLLQLQNSAEENSSNEIRSKPSKLSDEFWKKKKTCVYMFNNSY